MWKCPVCGKENETCLCGCGFDSSLDYEALPTLCDLGGLAYPSKKARRKQLEDRRKRLLHCRCGGFGFSLDTERMVLQCVQCGEETVYNPGLPKTEPAGKAPVSVPAQTPPRSPSHNTGFSGAGEMLAALSLAITRKQNRKQIKDSKGLFAAGGKHTAILRRSGTVEIAGGESGLRTKAEWHDIVCVAAGDRFTAALNKSGAIYVDGFFHGRERVSGWKDVLYICASCGYLFGVRKNGTVLSTGYTLSGWRNITTVAAGNDFVVGLQRDGTVVSAGSNKDGQRNAEGWKDIVDLAAGDGHTVGLKKDGTVVAAGYNTCGQCDVATWENIVAVSAGSDCTLGLREDGTVLSTLAEHKTSVGQWKDIIAVSAGWAHVVGLDRNGVFWAAGENGNGRCDVNGLKR